MGGNGYPSIHKFPPSSSPQICLASRFTPQPHQRYTEAGWWHCFSGLGSPCPRHFITLALKMNPVCTESNQCRCRFIFLRQSCVMSSTSYGTAAHVQSKSCRCPVRCGSWIEFWCGQRDEKGLSYEHNIWKILNIGKKKKKNYLTKLTNIISNSIYTWWCIKHMKCEGINGFNHVKVDRYAAVDLHRIQWLQRLQSGGKKHSWN